MNIVPCINVAALVVLLSGCRAIHTEHRDWHFVQSVGGMSIGQPERMTDGTWILPVECDVSGLRTVTVQPTTINSALACHGFTVRKKEGSIYLTLRTSLGPSARCKSVPLGRLQPGPYTVFYRDPQGTSHSLGSFKIEG